MTDEDWTLTDERVVDAKNARLTLTRHEHPRCPTMYDVKVAGKVTGTFSFGGDHERAKRWFSVLHALANDR